MLSFPYSSTLTSIPDYWKNHSFDYMEIVGKVMSLFFNMVSKVCQSFSSKEQAPFNFMAAVTICSDFGAQANEVCHCFHLLFHFIIRFIISSATVTQGAQRGKLPLPNSTQLRQYYFIKAEPQCYPEFRHLFNRSITSLLCAWRWPATWDTGRSRRASWPQTLGSERPRGGFLRFTLASRLPVGQP